MSMFLNSLYPVINSNPIRNREYIAEDGSKAKETSYADGTYVRTDDGTFNNVRIRSSEIHSPNIIKSTVLKEDLQNGTRTETVIHTVPPDNNGRYTMVKEEHRYTPDGKEKVTINETRYEQDGTEIHSFINEAVKDLNNKNAEIFYRNAKVYQGKLVEENSGYKPANEFNV